MSDCSWVWTDRPIGGLFMQKATHHDGYMRWLPYETEAIMQAITDHPYEIQWNIGFDRRPGLGLHVRTRTAHWGNEAPNRIRLTSPLLEDEYLMTPNHERGLRRMARTIQGIIADHIHRGLFPEEAMRRLAGEDRDQRTATTTLEIYEREGSTDPCRVEGITLDRDGRVRFEPKDRQRMLTYIRRAPAGAVLEWGRHGHQDPIVRAEAHRIRTGHLDGRHAAMAWRMEEGTGGGYHPDTERGREGLMAHIARTTGHVLRIWRRARIRATGVRN